MIEVTVKGRIRAGTQQNVWGAEILTMPLSWLPGVPERVFCILYLESEMDRRSVSTSIFIQANPAMWMYHCGISWSSLYQAEKSLPARLPLRGVPIWRTLFAPTVTLNAVQYIQQPSPMPHQPCGVISFLQSLGGYALARARAGSERVGIPTTVMNTCCTRPTRGARIPPHRPKLSAFANIPSRKKTGKREHTYVMRRIFTLTQIIPTSTPLGELPINLLSESFGWIRDRRCFAELFYTRLFEKDGDIRALFVATGTDMTRQAEAFLELIAAMIGLLKEGDIPILITAAASLGRKHQDYGVWPRWFETFGAALLETFPLYLAEIGEASRWTGEYQKAWEQSYSAITVLVLQGYVDASLLRTPIPLTFDVSGRLDVSGSEQRIAAHCFPPRRVLSYLSPVWVFLMHGGSYDWHYWHLPVEGYPPDTYSFAAYLAEHGIGAVVIDHPGCGKSHWDCPGTELTLERVALANYLAVQQMRARLANGDLIPGLAPVPNARITGIGHSMGGAIGTTMQSLYPDCFDALGVLGWTHQALQLGGTDAHVDASVQSPDNGYLNATADNRTLMRPFFYLEDVPLKVIEADERWATSIPIGVLSILHPGITAQYACRIRVPVLMLFGAPIDVVSDPMSEPEQYPNAANRTLFIQQGSAHCHCFSSQHTTVKLLILRWLWQIASPRGTRVPSDQPVAAG